MIAEALVLDRDHRRAHGARNTLVGDPLAKVGAELDQQLAVGRADPDVLAKVAAIRQALVGRQLGVGDRHRDAEGDHAEQGRDQAPFEQAQQPATDAEAGLGGSRCGTRTDGLPGHVDKGLGSKSLGGKTSGCGDARRPCVAYSSGLKSRLAELMQ